MGFRKYQKVEKGEVISPEEHAQIEDGLHKVGKTSLTDVTPDERESILNPKEDHLSSDN